MIIGDDFEGINMLKLFLQQHFHTKDLGKLQYFLGIEILDPYKASIYLRGNMYTGLLSSRPIDTPIDSNMELLTDGDLFSDPSQYR